VNIDIKKMIENFQKWNLERMRQQSGYYEIAAKLSTLQQDYNHLVTLNNDRIIEVTQLESRLKDHANEIFRLRESFGWNKEYDLMERSELNLNHTISSITYNGRKGVIGSANIPVSVINFIQPDDMEVRKLVQGFSDQYSDVEERSVAVYKMIGKSFDYMFDSQIANSAEFWMFPYELIDLIKKKKGGDCDDWANLIASCIIAAGMPEYRVRVAVGFCQFGYHSTVYVYSRSDKKWHHLNSTYGNDENMIKLTEYPTTDGGKNGTDPMGLYQTDLSFNNKYSWTELSSQSRAMRSRGIKVEETGFTQALTRGK